MADIDREALTGVILDAGVAAPRVATVADGTRYAETHARVYKFDADDADVTPMQRAMHAEICRVGDLNLHTTGDPACWRAARVARTVAALTLAPTRDAAETPEQT